MATPIQRLQLKLPTVNCIIKTPCFEWDVNYRAVVLNFLLQITREVETFMHMQKCTKLCLKPNKNDDFV